VNSCKLFASFQNACANFGAGLLESMQVLALLHIRVLAMKANCRANFSELEYGVRALFSQIAHES
jgi:hypothetical protein